MVQGKSGIVVFLISVIVPVFNSEKTISRCIESLLGQKTNKELEITVVDDASTDSTVEKLQKFSKKIVYLKNEKNKGPAFSRNLGAKKSKGDIVCFIDSDCVAEKNWLEEMVKPFEDEAVVAVQGAYKTRQKELIARFVQEEIEQRYEKMRKAKNLDWVGSYSAAYRKKVFLGLGGFDESFPIASGEDPDLSFRIAKKGHKIAFNEKAIVYHTHPDTLGKYLNTKFWRAFYRVTMYKKHPDKAVVDSYTPQVLKVRVAFFLIGLVALIWAWFTSLQAVWFVLVFFILFYLVTSLGFLFKAIQKDFLVGLISPIVLFLRDVYFGLGLAAGFFRQVFK